VAVILGAASGGLACRDFDDVLAYQSWAAKNPYLARILPTVRTARGYHVYFLAPQGFKDLGDGEYRATNGHFCLLPPSRHPDGAIYNWIVALPHGALPDVDPVQAGLLIPATPPSGVAPTQPPSHSPHTTHLCEQGKIPKEIAATLPKGVGQRRRCLFALAQRLKAIMPGASAAQLKPIVRKWFRLALPVIRSKEWSETWEDFAGAWQTVKYPVGGTWKEITRAAQSMTVDTGEYDGAAVAIIRLCAALQRHHGAGVPFALSCRKAGEVAGVSPERAARILKMLVFDDVIELVTPGGPEGSRIAATYRFLGDVS